MVPISVEVHIHDPLRLDALDEHRCREALLEISRQAGWQQAEFSIAIVSDADMARIHAEFLQDATTTDVMSFVLEQQTGQWEGELVVNGEMAARMAAEIGWQTEDELLWYIVHGALHLAGWEDTTPAQRRQCSWSRHAFADRRVLAGSRHTRYGPDRCGIDLTVTAGQHDRVAHDFTGLSWLGVAFSEHLHPLARRGFLARVEGLLQATTTAGPI